VRDQVALSIDADFENTVCKPRPEHAKTLGQMLDQLVAWGGALKTLRATSG